MNFRPTGARVFIAPDIQEMEGRFHLARMSRQMPDRGTVVAIAPKAMELTGVNAGDKVIYDRHYQQLSEDGKKTVVDAKYILALLA